jgi:hypothetical protein
LNQAMADFFTSGHVVDFIIAVLVVEGLALIFFRRGNSAPGRITNIIVAALPGICLLMALRAALTGAGWMFIALWLVLSFPAHLADLWRRPP